MDTPLAMEIEDDPRIVMGGSEWVGGQNKRMGILSCLLGQHFSIQIILTNGDQRNCLQRTREMRKDEGERGRRQLP